MDKATFQELMHICDKCAYTPAVCSGDPEMCAAMYMETYPLRMREVQDDETKTF